MNLVLAYAFNALWQVPLFAGAGWVLSRLCRDAHPRWVHRLGVAILIATTTAPLAGRAARCFFPTRTGGSLRLLPTVSSEQVLPPVHLLDHGVLSLSPAWSEMLLCACALVLLFALFRLVHGYRGIRVLIRSSAEAQLSKAQDQWMQWCRKAFTLRKVEVRSSPLVEGPAIVGCRRPVLLVPEGFLAAVSDEEWLAALGHECAHIARRDSLRNLLYECLCLPIAWHPVTRLLKEQVAQTREVACDRMVAERVMSPRLYAGALLRLAARIPTRTEVGNIYAVGIFDANILEERVMNLRMKRGKPGWSRRLGMGAAALLVAGCCTASAVAWEMRVDQSEPAAFSSKYTGRIYNISVEQGVKPPHWLNDPEPEFPKDVKEPAGFDGKVVAKAVVDKKGRLWDVQVIQSLSPSFDAAAVDSIRKYRFTPGTYKGKPVAVAITMQIQFRRY